MVASYVMPPCQLKSDFGELCSIPRLSFDEIVAIRRWSTSGAPKGRPISVKPPNRKTDWRLGGPDEVLAGGSRVRAEGGAYWRAYIIRIPAGMKNIKAFDVRPAYPPAIRHVLLSIEPEMEARMTDSKLGNDGPGFGTFGSLGPDTQNLVGAWAPGYYKWRLPRGSAIPFQKDRIFVAQVQYNPTGKVADGKFELALYGSRQRENRVPQWLSVGTKAIEIPPVGRKTMRAIKPLTEDIRVLAVHPEARLAAREMMLTAKLPNGNSRKVFGGSWDLYWIGAYNFLNPQRLPKGTMLELTIEYTNGLDAMHTPPQPEKIVYGYGPKDELGWVHLQYIPAK